MPVLDTMGCVSTFLHVLVLYRLVGLASRERAGAAGGRLLLHGWSSSGWLVVAERPRAESGGEKWNGECASEKQSRLFDRPARARKTSSSATRNDSANK